MTERKQGTERLRLWTVERPGSFPPRPAEVIWEDSSAEDLISLAKHCGYTVRGPYVLEDV